MTEKDVFARAKEAAQYIKDQGVDTLEVGLILGSGLGELADEIEDRFPSNPLSFFTVLVSTVDADA